MNKQELVDIIATKNNITKAAASQILSSITESIVDSVKKDNPVVLVGFGTFRQYARKARNARNPSTGAEIKVPATKLPKFVPGTAFKDAVDPKAAARRKGAAAPAPKKVCATKKCGKKK